MNIEELKLAMKEISDYAITHLFKEINKSDWQFGSNSYSINFGHLATESYSTLRFAERKINFYVRFTEYGINLSHSYGGNEDNVKLKLLGDKIIEVLKKHNLDIFVHHNGNYFDSKHKIHKKIQMFPIGPKSEEIFEYMKIVADNGSFNIHTWNSFLFISKSYCYRTQYHFTDLHDKDALFKIQGYRSGGSEKVLVNSKEDLQDFLDKIEEQVNALEKVEKDIFEIVKKVDITAYHNKEQGYINIFNERIPFHVTKVIEKGKEKYRARFYDGYNRGADLDKVVTKVKAKVETYIRKNRIKAAVSGKTHDILGRYLYKIYGYHFNGPRLYNHFITNINEGNLNTLIRNVIEEEMVDASEESVAYFQLYNRTRGRRHRITNGKKLGNVYCFLSASQLFVTTEEEMSNYNIQPSDLKQKKYRDELKKLESFIKTLYKKEQEV